MKIEYHNLYTHIIFITRNRFPYIKDHFRERLEKYITGVVRNHNSRLYAIYANPEHIHMLVSRSPHISELEFAQRIAESSKKFILENNFSEIPFAWQESAAAFSVSKSDVDKVCKYILNQEAHHKKISFRDEYDSFIRHYQQTLKWDKAA